MFWSLTAYREATGKEQLRTIDLGEIRAHGHKTGITADDSQHMLVPNNKPMAWKLRKWLYYRRLRKKRR